jgi:uncharacterized RDD family membrane protein YckC
MVCPAFAVRVMRVIACVAALIAVLHASAGHAADSPPEFFIAGGEQVAWSWRRVLDADKERRLLVVYTRVQVGDARFFLLPMHPTGAEVRAAGVHADDLYVFFKDGSLYRMRAPVAPYRAAPGVRHDFPELQLPDQRVPLALGGDASGEGLFAIVPSATAELLAEQAALEAGTNGLSARTPDFSVARYALVRYVPGGWDALAPMPADFDDQAAVWLIGHREAAHVFYAHGPQPDRLTHQTFADSAWSSPQTVPEVTPRNVIAVCAPGDAVVVLAQGPPDEKQRVSVRPHYWKDSAWTAAETLRLEDAELRVPPHQFAGSRLGDGLIAIWLDESGATPALQSARWPISGGPALTKAVAVAALDAAPAPAYQERTRFLLTIAAMALMLSVVVRGRRDSFINDLPVPEGHVLARLGPRAIAFFLDGAVICLIAVPVIFIPWLARNGVVLDEGFAERVMHAASQDPNGVFWRWLIATGVYAFYCIAFESMLGATPGKLAMRLRVCSSRAGRASFAAIVVRNLLRLEVYPYFHFSPIVVLVLFTRNRQRLGDLAANTVVVEKA